MTEYEQYLRDHHTRHVEKIREKYEQAEKERKAKNAERYTPEQARQQLKKKPKRK